MRKTAQKGFAHLSLLLLLLIVAAVVLVGYKVVKNHQSAADQVSSPSASQAIQPIKDTADLNAVESTLKSQDIDGNLNPDNYNQDVNSLL